MTKLNRIIFTVKFPLNYRPYFKSVASFKNPITRNVMLVGEENKKHDIILYGYLNRNIKRFVNNFYIRY